jgi:hypothetical protein
MRASLRAKAQAELGWQVGPPVDVELAVHAGRYCSTVLTVMKTVRAICRLLSPRAARAACPTFGQACRFPTTSSGAAVPRC